MYSAHSSRSCARCSKELTDAASMEAGVGPVCRKLDNHILATFIQADLRKVHGLLGPIPVATVPTAAAKTLFNVHELVRDILADKAPAKAEYRVEVKRLEYVISFLPKHDSVRDTLCDAVEAFGYIGLSSVLRGEAVKGEASVWHEGQWLFISAPRNKHANASIKSIPGRRFVPKEDMPTGHTHAGWKVPVGSFDDFQSVVTRHFIKVSLQGAMPWDAFKRHVEANSTKTLPGPVAPPKPLCRVEHAGSTLLVFTPYSPAFVSSIKALPYRDRKWDGAYRCWRVKAKHAAEVATIIERCYGEKIADSAAA